MQVQLDMNLSKKIQALAILSDQSVDQVVNAILSKSIESILPIQSLRSDSTIPELKGPPGAVERNCPAGRGHLAQHIREHALSHFIKPARERGEKEITVRTGDVHKSLNLRNRLPAVCAALGSDLFREFAGVELVRTTGPANGANTELHFRIGRRVT